MPFWLQALQWKIFIGHPGLAQHPFCLELPKQFLPHLQGIKNPTDSRIFWTCLVGSWLVVPSTLLLGLRVFAFWLWHRRKLSADPDLEKVNILVYTVLNLAIAISVICSLHLVYFTAKKNCNLVCKSWAIWSNRKERVKSPDARNLYRGRRGRRGRRVDGITVKGEGRTNEEELRRLFYAVKTSLSVNTVLLGSSRITWGFFSIFRVSFIQLDQPNSPAFLHDSSMRLSPSNIFGSGRVGLFEFEIMRAKKAVWVGQFERFLLTYGA